MDNLAESLPLLLAIAWLLPLASFTLIVLFGPRMGKAGVLASYVATGAIVSGFVCSFIALLLWLGQHPVVAEHHGEGHGAEHEAHAALDASQHGETAQLRLASYAEDTAKKDDSHAESHAADAHAADGHGAEHEPAHPVDPPHYSGTWYSLGEFKAPGGYRPLRIEIGYHIDALTIAMFTMITLIASCIHFYAIGYMHDELHEITDHEVTLSDGHHLHRPGRFYRFFQYLSLFCFSMLGLVIAGNIAMVFVFWELVGICSYFLIGFYIERKSASNAANKAFIVNRVGDFGMIIGLMALFGALGTFSFSDQVTAEGVEPGIFSLVRPADNHHLLETPDGMVRMAAWKEIQAGVEPTDEQIDKWRVDKDHKYGYVLLIVAGLGIFCGCVGKSAQFPLHVWLPDAMEGPTPVSALVHSATMVAAGVYLVGRFFPVFTPEVLLVIAYVGAITLFIAATIAITATDIKRVLAYSTVSQLGYMMLALGAGGWLAGMLHLFTHAFFKSLLFMCSGSVIHATHTNEMPLMGGLRKKMPWTAYTMLVGCMAISGFGIPFVIGLSGYYSKDAILAQHALFRNHNPLHGWLFYAAAGGAAITAFYMFRLWYLTFAGQPRDAHRYAHAHESPKIMYMPLVVLAVMAVCAAWTVPGTNFSLAGLLEQARPAGEHGVGLVWDKVVLRPEAESHHGSAHVEATLVASATALFGFFLATAFYLLKWIDPKEVAQQFAPIYRFLLHKWYFDELYQVLLVRPVFVISQIVSKTDKNLIDRFINALARWTVNLAHLDDLIDRYLVDGLVNLMASWTYALGLGLRRVQTGQLRQYVMFIVIGTVGLFVAASLLLSFAVAG